MKIVVDTNVLISAFLTHGTSKDVLEAVLLEKNCVLSPWILSEFRRVLLSKKFRFPKPLVEAFISYLSRYSQMVREKKEIKAKCPDPSDQKILALCLTIKAEFLITGDQELLALQKVGTTTIIRPADFWNAIHKS